MASVVNIIDGCELNTTLMPWAPANAKGDKDDSVLAVHFIRRHVSTKRWDWELLLRWVAYV